MPFENRMREARDAYDNGRFPETIDIVGGLIASAPDNRAVILLAETLEKLGMTGEAAEAFEHALHTETQAPLPLLRRAARLRFDAGDYEKALSLALDLQKRNPGDVEAAFVLASLASEAGKTEIVDAVKNNLVDSNDPQHLRLAALLIGSDLRNERNMILFKKLRKLFPADPYIRMQLAGFAREFCDYATLEAEEQALGTEIAAGDSSALAAEKPHYNLMWCSDEALNRLAANTNDCVAPSPAASNARRTMAHSFGQKIRIGYLSNDFWDDHATMRLLRSVLTAHDPEHFEVILFCYTPERFIAFDGGGRKEWGRIIRIEAMDDSAAIAAIRNEGIDILVDLKGHTGGSRSRLMNEPIAPVHVQWLGFPGSCLNVDCDYVIGDHVVLPDSARPHYHEKFCRLPESYQPNDPIHRILPQPVARRACGLPADRFVFSAFNSQRKNSPAGMDLWARVLRANPQALLWLMCDGVSARNETAAYMRRKGVGSSQLMFAQKMAYPAHMARVPAADLGLDSFPYNGHTTTSDMLWAGLPVVTFKGSNFASRVSESLLNAIGLPDLVADDADGFVALCTALAQAPDRVRDLKLRLAANRYAAPLFDAERFCRHLEDGYRTMVERAKAGVAPDHFDVPKSPARGTPFSGRVS
ncbi:MAG: hypothetical protein ACOH2J_07920 [Allorhizobium sp.]